MIRFYTYNKIPSAYKRIFEKITDLTKHQDKIFMVTGMAEDTKHVDAIHDWLHNNAGNIPTYKGALVSGAVISHDIASLLKLSLPLI